MSRTRKTAGLLLFIAYLGFISLGLPDTLIGVAWPSVRDAFGRQQSALAWIFFGVSFSYFLSSFFTGRLLASFSVGALLAASSLLVALSAFGYGVAPIWILFAACPLLHGLGSGAIDAGLNHYVATHFSARHMNWLHGCYGIGAMLGPAIMTAAVTSGSWRGGYLVVGALLLALSSVFFWTRRRWNDQRPTEDEATPEPRKASMAETLRHPLVWMQIAFFFLYTGLEVTVGQWSFTILTESRQVPEKTAGFWVALYWSGIAAGRFGFGFIVDRFGIDRMLRWSILVSIAGTAIFAWAPALSWAGLALAGLGLASIFPCMMTRTPRRLGPALSAHAIGFQVSAAMTGAAVLPALAGFLAQRLGSEAIPLAAAAMSVLMWLLHEALLFSSKAPAAKRA